MEPLESLAGRAKTGETGALEAFVRRIEDDVYRLALRMLGDPHDAQDAAQEILVKVVTNLGEFRGESGIRTWVWRIATNHVLSFLRSRRESPLTFEDFEGMLAAGLAADAQLGEPPEDELLEEEVKLGCTSTMLLCLDRDHRAAFALGEIFDLPGEEAAEVLEIDHATYRKRLSRARGRLRRFMERNCGLVSESAPCRCRRQIRPSAHAGLLDPDRPVLATHPAAADAYDALRIGERYLTVLRSHPRYAAPEAVRQGFRRLLERA